MAPRLHTKDSNVSPEVIASYAIEVGRASRELDEASGRRRNVLKRAKAAGVDTRSMLEVLALKKLDEEAVQAQMRTTLRYAGIIAPHIPLKQSDLFDIAPTRALNAKVTAAQLEWDAEQKGYDCGLNGGLLEDATYAKGTPAFVAFGRGFERGQTVIAERMGEHAKQADAGLAKRRGKMAAAAANAGRFGEADDSPGPGLAETVGNA